MMDESLEARAEEFRTAYHRIKDEIGKIVVGHEDIVHGVLSCLFTGGHCLLEGVPGLGKTLLVRTLGTVLDLPFKRIQFTPDLMPADIIGTDVISTDADGNRSFSFQKGPIFAQIVLADEINRATPKTQSALLEAMQEHSVTVGGTIHRLGEPFFVMATQNPVEQEGTYPLPEAQLDRFFFKLIVRYSSRREIATILDRTTAGHNPQADKVLNGEDLLRYQRLVQQVLVAPHVQDFAIRLILATHPEGEFAPDITNRYLRLGASPRGAQAIVLASKVRALVEGRYNVSYDDVRAVALPALRHRILPNFEAQAEGIDADEIIAEIMVKTPEKAELATA
jgi:MoxR-like ATPase